MKSRKAPVSNRIDNHNSRKQTEKSYPLLDIGDSLYCITHCFVSNFRLG